MSAHSFKPRAAHPSATFDPAAAGLQPVHGPQPRARHPAACVLHFFQGEDFERTPIVSFLEPAYAALGHEQLLDQNLCKSWYSHNRGPTTGPQIRVARPTAGPPPTGPRHTAPIQLRFETEQTQKSGPTAGPQVLAARHPSSCRVLLFFRRRTAGPPRTHRPRRVSPIQVLKQMTDILEVLWQTRHSHGPETETSYRSRRAYRPRGMTMRIAGPLKARQRRQSRGKPRTTSGGKGGN